MQRMLRLNLPGRDPLKVLCLGAHCDDIEIGCAGTLMTLQERHPGSIFEWVVFTREDGRDQESRQAAAMVHERRAQSNVEVLDFRMSYLPWQGAEVKDHFERIKQRFDPSVIFTHCLDDRHQDHRLVSELTWNTYRNHLVLEYEIPKYEGDLGHPNFYVPLAEDVVTRKLEMLMACFPSQRSRSWFGRDVFQAHLRLRGMECNSPSGHAEAFHVRKATL
jgi:LmbE family N-acetylglucosaminyl deacetylase